DLRLARLFCLTAQRCSSAMELSLARNQLGLAAAPAVELRECVVHRDLALLGVALQLFDPCSQFAAARRQSHLALVQLACAGGKLLLPLRVSPALGRDRGLTRIDHLFARFELNACLGE